MIRVPHSEKKVGISFTKSSFQQLDTAFLHYMSYHPFYKLAYLPVCLKTSDALYIQMLSAFLLNYQSMVKSMFFEERCSIQAVVQLIFLRLVISTSLGQIILLL